MPAIDREKLLSDIEKDIEFFSSSPGNHDYFDYAKKNGLVIAKQIVGRQPTIEPEVRHGRWEYRHADDWMFCTACGADAEGNYDEPLETDFCPHCGADMREECDDNA